MDNMSDLQRSFMKAQLSKLPPEAPLMEEAEEGRSSTTGLEEDKEESSSVSSASSTGTVVPSPSKNLFARPKLGTSKRKQSTESLSWTDFFAQELFLEEEVDDLHIIHHAYITPPAGSGPLFVMHHGAGSSGLSFAVVAEEIRKILPNAGVLSLDARHHGITTIETNSGHIPELDLRLETLARDLVTVVLQTQSKMGWESLPDLILVGHSLGGAVVTDVAKSRALGSKVLGYAVLDVVEGSAMDALQSMDTYLSTRPSRFPSVSSAIEWHYRSRTIRNNVSARISVPSLIREEGNPSDSSRPWVWRTNLADTKPFWEGWFIGLSKKFVEAPGGKLLLLAGTDRLDKELMIAQMQGKYTLQVIPDAGHFIQEDVPSKTAQLLVDFYKRNDRSALILPPKVGDTLATKAMEKGVGTDNKGTRPF